MKLKVYILTMNREGCLYYLIIEAFGLTRSSILLK